MEIERILICGASPDNGNRNVVLRSYVAEGFEQLLGKENVLTSPLEYAAERMFDFKPSVVLCFGSCMPDDANYGPLRLCCNKGNVAMVFWLHDDPYEFDFHYKILDVADVIFSNDRWSATHYNHQLTFHLPLAASKSAHWREIDEHKKNVDVFFCGVAFNNRVQLIRDLKPALSMHETVIIGDEWPADLPFCHNRRIPNGSLAEAYGRARITLNMGRNFHYANDRFRLDPSTPGPRTFEAAMAGTTQAFFVESLEILDYYRPKSEIMLYNSASEFAELIDQLLEDPTRCTNIAAAAQKRTVRDHTYANRAGVMLEILNRVI